MKKINKGEIRWHLSLFVGQIDNQDTYILTDRVQALNRCIQKFVKNGPNIWQPTKISIPVHGTKI